MNWFDLSGFPGSAESVEEAALGEAALGSEAWGLRAMALLEAIESEDLTLIMQGLDDTDDRVLLRGLENLVEWRERTVVDMLMATDGYPATLRDLRNRPDPRVRALATRLSGRILDRDPSLATEPLMNALSDNDPCVQQWALDAFREADTMPETEESQIIELLFRSPDPGVRTSAARLIRKAASSEAKQEMDEWLQGSELWPRYVGHVLDQISDP